MELVERIRTLVHRNPRLADLVTTCVVLALVLASSTSIAAEAGERAIDPIAVGLLVIASLAVHWRRTRPVAGLTVSTLLGFAYWIADYPNAGASVAMLVLLYSVAVYVDERRRATLVLVVFTTALLLVLAAGFFAHSEEEVTIGVIVFNVIMFEIAWLAGDVVRHRRDRIDALENQMALLEHEQNLRTEQVIAEERNRIARELHDILAHSMSVIVVQSEGARRLVGQDDDAVGDALDAIGSTGRQTLDDIRRMVGMVRRDEDRQPAPKLAMLPELIKQCSDAGLAVDLDVRGDPRLLPPMIELSGYRIVQESLTNAIKHGGPQVRAHVTVDYGSDALAIRVADTGRGAAADRGRTSGNGLTGMRERVEAFGGHFRSGPRSGGGYEIDATLPVTAS